MMGIVVDAGKTWKRECRICRNKIELISTGDDICRCPYCGATLMDCEPTPESLDMALTRVQGVILQYRNTSDEGNKKELRFDLRSEIGWLRDELDFFGKDQWRWHDWFCSKCQWSGYGPIFSVGAEKSVCPKCSSEDIHQRNYVR
jgi:hypothetical protein